MTDNEQNTKQQTLFDVKKWVEETRPYTKLTEKDYLAQINRCPIVFRTNDLKSIPADINFLEEHFSKDAFPSSFVSVKSYLAWRRKMICILKRFHGEFNARDERRSRNDEWSELDACLKRCVENTKGNNRKLYIPLSILIDESRKHGLKPKSLNQRNLDDLCADLPRSRRNAVISACRALQRVRSTAPSLNGLLPTGPLPTSESTRRNIKYPLADVTTSKIMEIASLISDGDYDEILDERVSGKRPATKGVYVAALRKYIGTAVSARILRNDTCDPDDWFRRETFVATMREIIINDDKARRISDRTLRSYVSILKICAIAVGSSAASIMQKALDANRNLRKGFEDAKGMPTKIQEFCSRLLKNRRMELLFLSLHIRFFQEAKALLENGGNNPGKNDRIIQLGTLAAYSSIALWGVPLRITNMLSLRHLGSNPSLILPHRSRDRAYILLDAADVKNKRPIKAALSTGPDKSLYILKWYLDEIRPKIPWADHSDYLFPGFHGPQLSRKSLRDWLYTASRELGLPMTPHNFRHGLASLYVKAHPGDYSGAARLLCNTPATVRQHYAWIDADAEMREVQKEVAKMAGYCHV